MVGSRSAEGFVHPAFFYSGAAEYLKGTVPFIRDGLAAGEPVAVAMPGPNLRLVLAELGSDAGRIRLLDMTRAGRASGRIIPSVLCAFVSAHPSRRVRIIGEHSWVGRAAREYPGCGQHEALINLAFAGRPVTMLCPYDIDRIGSRTLADAQACHPLLIDAHGERASAAYVSERFATGYDQSAPPATAASVTFNADNLMLARQVASDQATRLGLDGNHSEFSLIVGELTANSLVHGGGKGTLYIWAERGYLVCEVRDTGRIVDPLLGGHLVDPSRTNCRDLLLVNYLSDLVRQHSCPQGIATRVYLKLPSSGERSSDPSESIPAPRARLAPPPAMSPATPPSTPPSTPLPWQTYEALHAAERFGRYLPQDITASPEQPAATSTEQSKDWRPAEPVLEALTAVETLARVVDRWRARLVRLARTRGAPWTEIGQSLGVSKQAAHERYGRARRRRVSRELPGVGPLPPVQGT